MTFATSEAPFRFRAGSQPLLVSLPHVGTHLPASLAARLTPEARAVPDTDWHLERLYDFADALGASVLVATHSRYVIDLNRPPDGASLYPGQNVTGLCPVDSFDNRPLYAAGDVPGEQEVAARRQAVWQPYHDQLAAELARLRQVHGVAVLWDAHSIRSVVPRFFQGTLPDFNLGTGRGNSCDRELARAVFGIAQESTGYTCVMNGRFTGGYITRHYGKPLQGVHALQMEMTQSSYMQEHPPFNYLPGTARGVQAPLRRMLEMALAYGQHRSRQAKGE